MENPCDNCPEEYQCDYPCKEAQHYSYVKTRIEETRKRKEQKEMKNKKDNEFINLIGFILFALLLPFMTVGYILWWNFCLDIMGR